MPLLIALLALVGTVDSGYLTARHINVIRSSAPAFCSLVGGGCDTVERTSEATIMGIPTALIGLGYFVMLLAVAVWRIRKGSWPYVRFLEAVLSIGLLFSFYLVYVLLFEIGIACPFCLAAHSANALIVVLYAVSRRLDTTPPVFRARWAMGAR